MIKKQREKMALSCHSFVGRYKSPEIKTVHFLSEGVMCSSVWVEHEDFDMGESYDLDEMFGLE